MFGLVFLSIQLQISANNALFSLSASELIFFIFTTPMKIFSTLLVRLIENALDKTLNAFLYGLGTSIEFVLLKDNKHQLSCNTTPDLHDKPAAR